MGTLFNRFQNGFYLIIVFLFDLAFALHEFALFKGVLHPNFQPFSFELNKKWIFKITFDLGFRVLWPRKLKIFEIIFPLNSLMTSFLENLKPHNRLLTSIELLIQFNIY